MLDLHDNPKKFLANYVLSLNLLFPKNFYLGKYQFHHCFSEKYVCSINVGKEWEILLTQKGEENTFILLSSLLFIQLFNVFLTVLSLLFLSLVWDGRNDGLKFRKCVYVKCMYFKFWSFIFFSEIVQRKIINLSHNNINYIYDLIAFGSNELLFLSMVQQVYVVCLDCLDYLNFFFFPFTVYLFSAIAK